MRQLEPTIKKVGENTFAITPFSAFRAANLTGELASTLAPLAGAFAPLIGQSLNDGGEGNSGKSLTDKGLMDMDAGEAAKAISQCSGLSGDKLELLTKKLLLGGHIVAEFEEDGERKKEKLDADLANELFCGEVQDMFVLCFHVIQLNFNGFFKRLATQSGEEESATNQPRPML